MVSLPFIVVFPDIVHDRAYSSIRAPVVGMNPGWLAAEVDARAAGVCIDSAGKL
jgi:hypothetical protein